MQQKPDTSRQSRQLSSNLGRLLLEFGKDYERRVMAVLHERGHTLIRASHAAVFANIGLGAVRVTELANRAHVTQQAMGKMLKEMERIGYIVRDIDRSDRRAKKIRLTERGVQLLHDSLEAVEEIRSHYASLAGEELMQELEHCLSQCLRLVDPESLPEPRVPAAATI
jgi:DNA-binding MarR family transcriptional regulator